MVSWKKNRLHTKFTNSFLQSIKQPCILPTKRRKFEILSQGKATKKVKTSQDTLAPHIRKWKGPPSNQLLKLFDQDLYDQEFYLCPESCDMEYFGSYLLDLNYLSKALKKMESKTHKRPFEDTSLCRIGNGKFDGICGENRSIACLACISSSSC